MDQEAAGEAGMTDIPEKVERVARALNKFAWASVDHHLAPANPSGAELSIKWMGYEQATKQTEQSIRDAMRAIDAHEAALAAAGLVIVPREPTGELVSAGLEAFERRTPNGYDGPITLRIAQAYKAMVAAAPKQGTDS